MQRRWHRGGIVVGPPQSFAPQRRTWRRTCIGLLSVFEHKVGNSRHYDAGDAWSEEGLTMVIILIIVLLLVFGGGGGYYGYNRWGSRGGAGIGLGTVLLILLVCYLLGLL
jgi:hypothetical protein